ncbi:UNVERIFIED_CONTAM: hypothetical protein PYX00_000762 [Menopon gallinae]|uniref:AXH domain-containing protein n=1 Tax=Menopon gallinae TaxID=328185 RepID=A0AAW2IBH0_9NEOP
MAVTAAFRTLWSRMYQQCLENRKLWKVATGLMTQSGEYFRFDVAISAAVGDMVQDAVYTGFCPFPRPMPIVPRFYWHGMPELPPVHSNGLPVVNHPPKHFLPPPAFYYQDPYGRGHPRWCPNVDPPFFSRFERRHPPPAYPGPQPRQTSGKGTAPCTEQATAPTTPPCHFTKGALIQLANGELKKVEDITTEDFVSSAENCPAFRLDPSTVVRIEEREGGTVLLTVSYGEQKTIELESTPEHPYFVYGQGWASCSPERTMNCYGLKCHRLRVGDVCISLSPR